MWKKKYNIEIEKDEVLSDYDESIDYSELTDELNLNYDNIFEENKNTKK